MPDLEGDILFAALRDFDFNLQSTGNDVMMFLISESGLQWSRRRGGTDNQGRMLF